MMEASFIPRTLRRNKLEKSIYFKSKAFYKYSGLIPKAWKTNYTTRGKRVILIHNPKAAGTSLKNLLSDINHTSHSMPSNVCSEKNWINSFSICAIRDPFERFISGYIFMTKSKFQGVLYRKYGEKLFDLNPFTFLEFIKQYPEKLGPQVNWVSHYSKVKPRCDLILRTEESHKWIKQLKSHGIETLSSQLYNLNSTSNNVKKSKLASSLTKKEITMLRHRVWDYYKTDYELFGYQKNCDLN